MPKRLQNTHFINLLPGSIAGDATIQAASATLDTLLHKTVLAVPNLLLFARLCITAGRTMQHSMLPALERLIHARGGLKPLSTAELELLAWQFHVDFRQVATTDVQLAEMVLQSIPWHRIKGTPRSIINALALFGYGVASPPGTAAGRAAERALSKTGTAFPSAATPAIASAAQEVRSSGITIEEDGVGQHWATYQLGLPQIADVPTVKKILSIAREMQPVRCRLWRVYTTEYDCRPIILSRGPVLGDGWLSYHSGVSVDTGETPDGDVIVSFGVKNTYQSEQYALCNLLGSFGSTTHLGFVAPYLDTFCVGRSRLSGGHSLRCDVCRQAKPADAACSLHGSLPLAPAGSFSVYPRNNPFVVGSLFSILWADRATAPRRWRGEWDARSWLDYTGFDRKLPLWRVEKRATSKAQLVPSWPASNDGGLSNHNSKLGVAFATVINAPARLGDFRLSAHNHQKQELRLHEFHIDTCRAGTAAVIPATPASNSHTWQDHATQTPKLHNEHWCGSWKGQGIWRHYVAYTNIIHEYKEF